MEPHVDASQWVEQALAPTSDPAWVMLETGYDPTREAGIEARFAIGNGFLGVRAARSVSRGPIWTSYQHNLSWASWPRTYVAGLFDTPNTEPPVPALVPAPDWLRCRIWINGEVALIRSGEMLAHYRWLDMRRGLMITEWHQRHPSGRIVRMRTLRFVSQADRALAGQLLTLAVDGEPAAVRLDVSFEALGSALESTSSSPDLAVWHTYQSAKTLAIAGMAELHLDGSAQPPEASETLNRCWRWTSVPGQEATLLRLAAFVLGDAPPHGEDSAAERATAAIDDARKAGWRAVLAAHERAWSERWADSDVEIEGDDEAQRAVRFAIYHLISAADPADERVSVGARALTGDSYLGHVFWDTEIYLLPFYTLTWPQAARALLMYRYHTLPGARAKAARMGYRGAFYAWESADTGEETTPEKIIDPNGRVIQVLCGIQEWHIVADVAYAVWRYWEATGDDAFMREAGAEILLETARFWASCAAQEQDGRYHIRGIIGPDEYHEHIDDNAFTNVMARWTLQRAADLVARLREAWPEHWQGLARRLGLGDEELAHWREVAERLVVHFDPQTGLFEQFEGYFGLEDIDIAQYEGRTVPMDVVLGRERTQRSQVIKQADVVAMLALLPEAFDRGIAEENFRYYEPRCGHGSSLSHAMHAVVAARLGQMQMAIHHFQKTAATDLGQTTVASAGGIRIAAQGGLWQAAILGFAGLSVSPEGVTLRPSLPPHWRSLAFRLHWRGRRLHLRITQNPDAVNASLEGGEPMTLTVGDQPISLAKGATERFLMTPAPEQRRTTASHSGE